ESRQRRRAPARERETALVIGIAHLRKRLRFGEDAEPAERKDPIVDGEQAFRDRRATDAVKAVAARDDVALQRFGFAFVLEMNRRTLAGETFEMRGFGLEQN